ncbi:MAG: NfeD family protein [Methanomicrobiales archaeon]|jgi:membrane-bound ClpP family serine protease|nr:NfeD family protein [Methanomicrobiales archaeon]
MVLDLSFGWLLIVLGTALLVIEAFNPGFFAAVPGTVMIILGVLLLLGVDIFSSVWGVVVGVVIAIAAAAFTIWLYSRITPDGSPVTISRDSLVGLEGRVLKETDPDTIAGKVMIAGQEWSARSASDHIAKGKLVKVVRSEGVHIIVEEVA